MATMSRPSSTDRRGGEYLTITNHVYSPWIRLASKKWWDGLSKDEKNGATEAAKKSREFERKDTREEAARALAELKAKAHAGQRASPAEANRMREKLSANHASIANLRLGW